MKNLEDVLRDESPYVLNTTSSTHLNNIVKALQKLQRAGADCTREDFIIDIGGSTPKIGHGFCPCITKTRAGNMAFYSVKRYRRLSVDDMLKLQGFDPRDFAGWQKIVSTRQMGMMVGNAMTLSIMERLMRQICLAMGYSVKSDGWIAQDCNVERDVCYHLCI